MRKRVMYFFTQCHCIWQIAEVKSIDVALERNPNLPAVKDVALERGHFLPAFEDDYIFLGRWQKGDLQMDHRTYINFRVAK